MIGDIEFDDGDPFDDPAWKNLKTKHRHSRLIGCPVDWFAWVLPLVRSQQQLAMALYLYRRCHVCHSNTVTVPTEELEELGLGRWSKYRLLISLEQVGILAVVEQPSDQPRGRGRMLKVRLLHWPDPPKAWPPPSQA